MSTEEGLNEETPPNWAYPLARICILGAVLEIAGATVLTLLFRTGLIPLDIEPAVNYVVIGAAISGSVAMCTVLLYWWIRPSLDEEHDS